MLKFKRYCKNRLTDIAYIFKKAGFPELADRRGFRILLYHSIGESGSEDVLGLRVSREEFFKQMKFLRDGRFNVISLHDAIASFTEKGSFSQKTIAITFDDGYKDNLTEAGSILREFGFAATVFACFGYLDNKLINFSEYWEKWGFLSLHDLNLLGRFNMDIGLHSFSHKRLSRLSQDKMKEEIAIPKKKLEEYLGRKIALFSYPHGSFNNRVISLLKSEGFTGACCSERGVNNSYTDPYRLKRTEITSFDTLFEFKKKILGCYDLLPQARVYA